MTPQDRVGPSKNLSGSKRGPAPAKLSGLQAVAAGGQEAECDEGGGSERAEVLPVHHAVRLPLHPCPGFPPRGTVLRRRAAYDRPLSGESLSLGGPERR